jgi:hypothetical protein
MKRFIAALILIAPLLFIACTKGGTLKTISGDQYTITSNASSKQLVPAIDTTSTGTLTGIYDEQTNILTFNITWTDLWRTASKDTISSINIYGPASATANGTLVRSLSFVNTNNQGTANLGLVGLNGLTTNEKKDFLAGNWYFTINTKKYPAGIIRGQLAAAKQ